MSLRERLGWNPFFDAHAAALAGRGYLFARIVEEQRGLSRVFGEVDAWMEVSGKFRYEPMRRRFRRSATGSRFATT